MMIFMFSFSIPISFSLSISISIFRTAFSRTAPTSKSFQCSVDVSMSSPARRHRSRSRSMNKHTRHDQRSTESRRYQSDRKDRNSDRKKSRSRSHHRRNEPQSTSRRGRSPDNKKGRIGNHEIPSSFVQSDQCWDISEVYGLNLPRYVATTPWTIKQGTAGKAIESLPIIDTTYDGPSSYGLRLLASGRYTSIEFTRSYKESCLIQHVLQLMRARQESNRSAPVVDIDLIAEFLAKQKSLPFVSPAEKKIVYNLIADHMVDSLKNIAPIRAEDALRSTIEKLEKENAKLRANPHLSSSAKQAPSPKAPLAKNLIKDALTKNAKSKPLPVSEDDEDKEEDNEEPPEDVLEPLSDYRRKSKRPYLSINAPATKSAKDYNTFVNSLKLTSAKKKALDKAVESAIAYLRTLDNNDKAHLDSIAVEWGLPVKIAAVMDATMLMKTIAVAKFMTM